MQYNSPFGSSDPNAPYVDGNASTGDPGSIVPAHAVEYPMREIINVILGAGITPSNSVLTQLRDAINALIAAAIAASGGGGGGGGGAFLPLGGGNMYDGGSIGLHGSAGITLNGHPFWNADNDGAGSGMDTDKVQGVDGSKFMRNDRDTESAVNGGIVLAREAVGTGGTRGKLQVRGKTGLNGGATIQMLAGDGSTVSCELLLADDRRSIAVRLFSDNGTVFEDQARVLDSGKIWTRASGILDDRLLWESKSTLLTSPASSISYDISGYEMVFARLRNAYPTNPSAAYVHMTIGDGNFSGYNNLNAVNNNTPVANLGIFFFNAGLNVWALTSPQTQGGGIVSFLNGGGPPSGDGGTIMTVSGGASGYDNLLGQIKKGNILSLIPDSGQIAAGSQFLIYGLKKAA